MAAKKYNPGLPEDTSVNARVQAQQIRNAALAPGIRVPVANGQFVALTDLIDIDARPGDHTAIFSDTARFLKNPNAECAYAWVNYKKDAEILGKVRSKAYRIVDPSEIKDDEDIPIATHKMAGQDFVMVYDVVLVEVQPRAVKELYKSRERVAVQKVISNDAFAVLKNMVHNATEGRATAELSFKELKPGQ